MIITPSKETFPKQLTWTVPFILHTKTHGGYAIITSTVG